MAESDALVTALIDACNWASEAGVDPAYYVTTNSAHMERIEQIERTVEQHRTLSSLDGKFLRCGGAIRRLSHRQVAHALFARAFVRNDPQVVVGDLIAFIQNPETDVLTVFTVFGVKVDDKIALNDTTSILPPSLLPQSQQFRMFFPTDDQWAERRIFQHLYPPPTAAIVYKWRMRDAIPNDPLRALNEPNNSEAEQVELERALTSIMLSSGVGIQQIHRYNEHLNPGHIWAMGGYSEKPMTPTLATPETLDPDVTQRVMERVTAFRDWDYLRRLARRLNGARTKTDLVDAHIDLGIVAECALTKGDRQEAEIGLRLRTRSAWLLGHTGEHRRQVARAMGALYGRRSSAAH